MKKYSLIIVGVLVLISICVITTIGIYQKNRTNHSKDLKQVVQQESEITKDYFNTTTVDETTEKDSSEEDEDEDTASEDSIDDIQTFIENNDEKKVHDIITGKNQTVPKQYLEDIYSFDNSEVHDNEALLDVKYLSQLPVLPTGCEITSLTTVLNYYGFSVSKETMADDYLPKCNFGEGSFTDYFLGNPRNDYSYGCYAGPIVKAADSFLNSSGGSFDAYNYSGHDFSALLNQVAAGRPVVMWCTIDLRRAYRTMQWVLNGKTEQWIAPEHCVVLTGYNVDANTVTISDPLHGIVTYDLKTMVIRYGQMQKQAVLIKPSNEPVEPEIEKPTDPTKAIEPETEKPIEPVTEKQTESTEPTVTKEKETTIPIPKETQSTTSRETESTTAKQKESTTPKQTEPTTTKKT